MYGSGSFRAGRATGGATQDDPVAGPYGVFHADGVRAEDTCGPNEPSKSCVPGVVGESRPAATPWTVP